MDWQRNTLIVGIIAIGIALVIKWEDHTVDPALLQRAQAVQTTPAAQTPDNATPTAASDIPAAPNSQPTVAVESTNNSDLLHVSTPQFDAQIALTGGDLVSVKLREHTVSTDDPEPLAILVNDKSNTYIAQSGLIGPNGTDKNGTRPTFTAAQTDYSMGDASQLDIPLTYTQADGTVITKHYIFTAGSYAIDVKYDIDNMSSAPWSAHMYGQVKRDDHAPVMKMSGTSHAFLGMATTNADKNYFKQSFDDLADQGYSSNFTGGWMAMVQHYFISAWIPAQNEQNAYYANKLSNGLYRLGYTSPVHTILAGETGTLSAQYYVGPKNQKRLEALSNNLDLTVDYGWLWFIAQPMHALLTFLHNIVGNWGFSIILLTLMIKGLLYYPSAISYRSMAKMRKFTPLMNDIKERFGDDRQKQQQEMMKLYQKEKINPMSSCLPVLLQMPIFIALYWMLSESVELRHAPFFGWITDLSAKDPYFILPVLNAAAMWFQQRLNPPATDPMQAKVMQFMPLIFGVMFMMFPAGLVLYWLCNSLISMLQQWLINRSISE